MIQRSGILFELKLLHRAFHRAIGCFGVRVLPDGHVVTQTEWDARRAEWLPTETDEAFVGSLMHPVIERGKFANWIAPPARGINGHPIDFGYVRLD